jgi:hypothetical protein
MPAETPAAVGLATQAAAQKELREKLLAGENKIAALLDGMERELGVRFIRIDLVRFDSGYKPILRIGQSGPEVC